ncbi:MAG: hypothetical protein HDR03_11260 [Lachnospiraceae bacterium]|nr:hypothetical protein [Lachnospiraceae bacterium]
MRSEILKRINRNEGLTHEDRHYLRFVLKIDVSLSSILCRKKIEIPKEMESRYAELRSDVSDMEKLH